MHQVISVLDPKATEGMVYGGRDLKCGYADSLGSAAMLEILAAEFTGSTKLSHNLLNYVGLQLS